MKGQDEIHDEFDLDKWTKRRDILIRGYSRDAEFLYQQFKLINLQK